MTSTPEALLLSHALHHTYDMTAHARVAKLAALSNSHIRDCTVTWSALSTIENAFDAETPSETNIGLGLAHVRRRLQVLYGAEAAFDAGPHGDLYRVVLRFPCESPMASSSRA